MARLYILSPNGNDISNSQMSDLKKVYSEIIYVDKVMDFSALPKISDDTEKVIAIDPDFCNWKIPNSALDINGLKAICLNTTSYSWVDLDYAKQKNIIITNIRNYSTNSVAEHGILMALMLARKIPLLTQNNMRINFATMLGSELYGKTAGIIGLGHIGTRLCELCQGLGMNVVYWSAHSRNEKFKFVELEQLFKEADIVFPALLKNKDTEKIITDELLTSMKAEAIFCEITENFLYNHDLMINLAKNNKIGGYGFEELSDGIRYTGTGNILSLPPVAYYTVESIKRLTQQWSECAISIFDDTPKNKVY